MKLNLNQSRMIPFIEKKEKHPWKVHEPKVLLCPVSLECNAFLWSTRSRAGVNSGIPEWTWRQHDSILPISSLLNNISPVKPPVNFKHRHGCPQVGWESDYPEAEYGETVLGCRKTPK